MFTRHAAGRAFARRDYRRALVSGWFPLVPVLALVANDVTSWKLRWLFVESFMNFPIAFTLDKSMRTEAGTMAGFFTAALLRRFGALSYSLYLWQQIFLNRQSQSIWCVFPWNVILTFAAGAISFWLIEKPLLSLRSRTEPALFPEPGRVEVPR